MDNFIEDEIVSIEYLGERETIDITVSDDNLFLANGILTHNSGYGKENPGMETVSESIGVMQTGDVGVSIFQSDEDKELGIIKIGMMRNRYGPMGMVQAMKIEYETLSIVQSDEDEEFMDDDNLGILERLANR
jgi:hypothetical protein